MGKWDDILESFLKIHAQEGLPEELFIAISTLMPVANVDLLVLDERGRILLAWRDDRYFGKGWHLPGGCVRYKETMLERVEKTAISELRAQVEVNPEPITVRDVILGKDSSQPRMRAHHLAVLYECGFPQGFRIDNKDRTEKTPGFLRWFEKIPDNILAVHSVYQDIFQRYGLM